MTRCIDTIVDHYLTAAIFTAGDGELDAYSPSDFTQESRDAAKHDIEEFLKKAAERGIDTSMWSDELLGHDFSLTRNGHGAGFWDRGYPNDIGRRLTSNAHAYGSCDVCLSNDGKLRIE